MCDPILITHHTRSTHLGIVMDYVEGGNMADYILKV